MAETGYHQPRRIQPVGLAAVVAIHGAAIAALLLAKGPEIQKHFFPRTVVDLVPIQPDPPPEPQPQPEPRSEPRNQRSQIDTVPPVVPSPPRGPVIDTIPMPPQPWTPAPSGNELQPQPQPRPEPIPEPRAEPVRVEAELDRGVELQPPYPASEQRNEREGSVTIRLTISPAGRVTATERVRATSDAFWQATDRHARARWRFRPATVDGRPVESRRTLTVHFRITD